MAEGKYLAAIDAGTGAGRCLLISLDGKQMASAYREWQYTVPADAPSGWEFDADQFWRIIGAAVQEAIQKSGVDPRDIVAVSTTSQREGIVLLDKEKKAVYAGPNLDGRAGAESRQMAGELGPEIYRVSGHWPEAMFAPARLWWLKQHRPAVYAAATHLLMINDWVVFRLCGELTSEPTNASETLLYDIGERAWSQSLAARLQVDPAILAKVYPAGTVVGSVSRQAAAETGLAAGTPVVVGGADTQCGLLGLGAIQPGALGAIAGTTTPLQLVTDRPVLDPAYRLWTGCHVVPGQWVLESNARATGISYRWFRDAFGRREELPEYNLSAEEFERMNEAAAAVPPGANGVMALAGPLISNVSRDYSLLNGFVGIRPRAPERSGRKEFIRAILENMAYAIRGNWEQLGEVTGSFPATLAVGGGSAKNPTWLEILTNVLEVPVWIPRVQEVSSVGCAICAGVGAGVYPDFAAGVDALVATAGVFQPETGVSALYRDLYAKWLFFYREFEAMSARAAAQGIK